jgi:glyoxylase-like metal-dependent hydrolase (beta-lactamase superfamily II)
MKAAAEKGYRDNSNCFVVAPGVWGLKIVFVNVFFVLNEKDHSWVLVDAGLMGSAGKIKDAAEELFGLDAKPSCIVLTHGHFDHRGALEDLLHEWNVPVFANTFEHPYLNGTASYPPPDPTVGGGMMSWMSWMYPKKSIDISNYLKTIPANGDVPGLQQWKWLHTPGHTPGHISLFREEDRTLIAGDAFVTTKQESAFSTLSQREELSGPPKYFTTDWIAAKHSVEMLASLAPEIVATGHGKPMYGMKMRRSLSALADAFEELAVPDEGRYVDEPARADEHGPTYVPPQHVWPVFKMFAVLALTFLAGFGVYKAIRKAAS